jgi:hypothetical protein
MPFFPFLNITGIFICIGIGADDIFVFLEALDLATRSRSRDAPLAEVYAAALYDAGAATLVTSLTTAAAFLSTIVSPITSIKCFGVFCSAVVLCDWVLMITYLPALCVVYRRQVHFCCGACECCPNQPVAATEKWLKRPSVASHFAKLLTPVVTHRALRVVFLALSVGAGVGLGTQSQHFSYPSTGDVQLFPADSPLERYCCTGPQAKNAFHQSAGGSNFRLWLEFVWGIEPVDNGNPWDPSSHTSPPLVPIDPTASASQLFIKQLCESAREAPWYHTPSLANCSFEVVMQLLEVPCSHMQSPSGICCDVPLSSFPYAPSLLGHCLRELANETDGNALAGAGRLLFDRVSGEVATMSMQMPTVHFYSQKYFDADAYWTEMRSWSTPQLAAAPTEMQGGFATLGQAIFFYTLQVGTGRSALESTIVAAIFSGVVILLLTANVLIAIYCTLVIGLIILAVTGIVVLNGWTLGIIESVIFSTAIGMACDFVAHLGFAYRQANQRREAAKRDALVAIALGRIGPAVTAAAVSTGMMGLLMLFSSTIFNRNFGFFIMILMTLSWVYAIFCLLPLLSLAGPLGDFLEIPLGKVCCGTRESNARPRTVGAASGATSSSCTAS